MSALKRNNTEDPTNNSKTDHSDAILEQINVSHGHGSNIARIRPPINPDKNINKINDANRNQGYTLQRKLEVLDEIDKQKVVDRNNLPQLSKDEHLKSIKLFPVNPKQPESQQ